MADKNYEPEVVQDNPFPGEVVQSVSSETQGSDGNFAPTVMKEKNLPKKRTAVELLSTALNTRSKKILQEFQLEQSGGIQIGNFQDGETGDVRITPNGLTGRNNSGIVTFGLDTDGNLVLIGEIRSGSVITGEVIVGNNSVIIDGENRNIIINDGVTDRILIGYQENGF